MAGRVNLVWLLTCFLRSVFTAPLTTLRSNTPSLAFCNNVTNRVVNSPNDFSNLLCWLSAILLRPLSKFSKPRTPLRNCRTSSTPSPSGWPRTSSDEFESKRAYSAFVLQIITSRNSLDTRRTRHRDAIVICSKIFLRYLRRFQFSSSLYSFILSIFEYRILRSSHAQLPVDSIESRRPITASLRQSANSYVVFRYSVIFESVNGTPYVYRGWGSNGRLILGITESR